jgi:hypothetical protein
MGSTTRDALAEPTIAALGVSTLVSTGAYGVYLMRSMRVTVVAAFGGAHKEFKDDVRGARDRALNKGAVVSFLGWSGNLSRESRIKREAPWDGVLYPLAPHPKSFPSARSEGCQTSWALRRVVRFAQPPVDRADAAPLLTEVP